MLGADRYAVQRVLGRGGSAVVELALDVHGRAVALKRVPLGGSADEIAAARHRLRREAELLSRLEHPAIVPLLDVVDDGADVVLVMPYLAGGSLADRVRERGPLPAADLEHLTEALLDALALAHAGGVVHRDVTPRNVLFDGDGRPALADFGIASSPALTVGLTRAGGAFGTPGFLAPEVARGEPATPATDLFGLGATLLHAATGGTPFGHGSAELLAWRAARGEVEAVPASVPARLRPLLVRMLDPRPEARPPATVLRRQLGGPASGSTDPLPWPVAPPPAPGRRRPPGLVWAGLLAAVLATACGLVWFGLRSAPASTEPAQVASPGCTSLPYQPCGEQPAPFTDGRACLDDHADYDGDAANGCEAAPDGVDGTELVEDWPIIANAVPEADTDTYPAYVGDNFHLLCDGTFAVTLTGPAGAAQKVEITDGEDVLAEAVSEDGEPATAQASERGCLGDDSGWYDVVVTSVDGRSAENYTLERSGSF